MTPQLELAAITDEFSPQLETALEAMSAIGMTGAELRVVWGRNILDHSDAEVARATDLVHSHGMRVLSIASPLLKCVLPGAGEVDTRFQQDSFNSAHTFAGQPRLAERALRLCELTGARIVRVFSYWRTVEPARCHEAICKALSELTRQAAPHGVIIGLENEHACNVGTAAEAVRVLNDVPDANLQRHTPVWGLLGTRQVDWKGQIAALLADGYRGAVSLETHWSGPGGDKLLGSTICGWNLRGLLAA
jgi:sugar phosphate isomerase/epimerase